MTRCSYWIQKYVAGAKIENACAAIIEGLNRVYWRQKRSRSVKLNYSLKKKKRTILVTQSLLRSRYRKLIGDHRCKTRSISFVYVHTNARHIGSNTALQKSTIRLRAYLFSYFLTVTATRPNLLFNVRLNDCDKA